MPGEGADAPVSRTANPWWQLVRFAAVGASGYFVNLAVFAAVLHVGGHYRIGATVAFLVAVVNNFCWHRRWTFAVRHGRRSRQGIRFLIVSVAGFLFSLAGLSLLVDLARVPALPAQLVATSAWLPLSYLSNRLWAFGA